MSRLISWLVILPLFIAVVVFAVNNNSDVGVSLWPIQDDLVRLPVHALVLIGLFFGFVIGGAAGWAQGGAGRKRARQLARRVEADDQQIAALQDKVARFNASAEQTAIPAPPSSGR